MSLVNLYGSDHTFSGLGQAFADQSKTLDSDDRGALYSNLLVLSVPSFYVEGFYAIEYKGGNLARLEGIFNVPIPLSSSSPSRPASGMIYPRDLC